MIQAVAFPLSAHRTFPSAHGAVVSLGTCISPIQLDKSSPRLVFLLERIGLSGIAMFLPLVLHRTPLPHKGSHCKLAFVNYVANSMIEVEKQPDRAHHQFKRLGVVEITDRCVVMPRGSSRKATASC